MLSRRNALIVAGASAFLVFLVALLPAGVAVGWLAPEATRLRGVTGTLWSGSASAVEIGNVHLGATRWSLSPFGLLLGRLAGDLETRLGDAEAGGSVALGLAGGLSCNGCRYDGSLSGLRPLFPALKALDGHLQLEITAFTVRDGWPTRAVGTARLSRVPLAMAGAPAGPSTPTGDFEATLAADPVPDDGALTIAVRDTGGPLQMAGTLRVSAPGSYEFAGRAKTRANAPAELGNALNVLGPRTADGSTEISASGSF